MLLCVKVKQSKVLGVFYLMLESLVISRFLNYINAFPVVCIIFSVRVLGM